MTIDLILVGWGVMNVVINVLLVRGYRPGKQFSLSTMTLDILFAASLVYPSDGFSSPFFLALFLAVITNGVRFGATASFYLGSDRGRNLPVHRRKLHSRQLHHGPQCHHRHDVPIPRRRVHDWVHDSRARA